MGLIESISASEDVIEDMNRMFYYIMPLWRQVSLLFRIFPAFELNLHLVASNPRFPLKNITSG